jgi:hypothetical protein
MMEIQVVPLEACFVVEFAYLEAQLHMWQHLTFGVLCYIFLYIFLH